MRGSTQGGSLLCGRFGGVGGGTADRGRLCAGTAGLGARNWGSVVNQLVASCQLPKLINGHMADILLVARLLRLWALGGVSRGMDGFDQKEFQHLPPL